jgi:hypothetical protein
MPDLTGRAYLLALHLLSENRIGGRSWRSIAEEDFNGKVNHATLCRFALSGGTWIPKDRKIQKALGLIKPRTQTEKTIAELTKVTRAAVFGWKK